MSNNPGPDPSMRPTSLSALLVAGLAAAAVGWLLLGFFYFDSMTALPWLPTIVIFVLAICEGILAQNTAARIQRKPGAGPVVPLAIARYAVLAKASSLAGALSAGFSLGLAAWLAVRLSNNAAQSDLPAAVGGAVAGLALIGAALWLERACRVPEQPDRKDGADSGRA